jgi:serine/threonine-protein kinase PpkA
VPFPGQTLAELLAQHLVAPVPRLPQAHAAWQPLLDAMLHKEPQARPADGEALLAALAQWTLFPSQPSCHGGTGNRAAS